MDPESFRRKDHIRKALQSALSRILDAGKPLAPVIELLPDEKGQYADPADLFARLKAERSQKGS